MTGLAERKRHGRYYTPLWLAREVIHAAMSEWSSHVPPRVLDPAIGRGVFVRAYFDWISKDGRFSETEAASHVYGFETDSEALAGALRLIAPENGRLENFLSAAPSPDFDLVVGNPPWVSYSGRQAQRPREGISVQGWRSLHAAFVVRAAEWLRPGGRFALLVPYSLCHQRGYGPTRAALRKLGRVESVRPLGEGVFDGVTEPAALIVWTRGAGVAGEGAPFHVEHRSSLAQRLLEEFRNECGTGLYSDGGVHSGNAAELIIRDGDAKPADGRRSAHQSRPMREGRDIEPFGVNPPTKRVYLNPKLPHARYARVPAPDILLSQPIVIRQTACRPIAAVHEPPEMYRNSVLGCSGLADHDPHYVVALLNSRLMGYLLRQLTPDVCQRAFPQVKVSDLEQLPLRRIKRNANAGQGRNGYQEQEEAWG